MGQLQYKSTAFQMYYRNTPALARIHAKVMESSDNYMFSPVVATDIEDIGKDQAD